MICARHGDARGGDGARELDTIDLGGLAGKDRVAVR